MAPNLPGAVRVSKQRSGSPPAGPGGHRPRPVSSRHIEIVLNPAAGAGRAAGGRMERVMDRWRRGGWTVGVQPTSGAGDAIRLAADAARSGAGIVVAAGGDGTVNEVVSGVLSVPGTTTEVGVLPWGTGNDIAALLGVVDEHTAVEAVLGGRPEAWDVIGVSCRAGGIVVERPALLFAACGFAGDLLRATTPAVKRCFGRHAYPVGFFRALLRFHPFRLSVSSPEFTATGPWVVALAANTPHAGGRLMRIGPGASWTDGRMDVSLVSAVSRFEVARQFVRLMRGTHVRHPRVRYYPTTFLGVDSDRPQDVAVDGDLIGTTPTEWRIRPGAVRMRAQARG